MHHLKANTQVSVPYGPVVSIADGFTMVTTLDTSTADSAMIIKHGATAGVDVSGRTDGAYAASAVDGMRYITLTTTDTNTEGCLTLVIEDVSLALPIVNKFQVLSEAAYDSLYAAKDSGYMDVNTNTVTSGIIATDIWNAATASYGGAGTYGQAVEDTLADTNELQGDWANGGRLDLLIDSILADTGELQTDWANGGRLDLIIDAILNDTDLIDDGTSGLAKIATDVAAVLVDTNELQTDDIPTLIGTPAITDLSTMLEYVCAALGYWTTVSDTGAGTIVIKDSVGATLRTITFTTDSNERTGVGS